MFFLSSVKTHGTVLILLNLFAWVYTAKPHNFTKYFFKSSLNANIAVHLK